MLRCVAALRIGMVAALRIGMVAALCIGLVNTLYVELVAGLYMELSAEKVVREPALSQIDGALRTVQPYLSHLHI